ncbi:hypothetical protein [Paraburkholderia strydomiana]|uniref:hypothetical protein n=1 Tax=Paraburkholderia strydomiana TaxID=1245417 RepID=UPI0038B7D0EA
MQFFDIDHLTGELLDCNRTVLDEREQFAIKRRRQVLGWQRFAEDRRDIECVRIEQGAIASGV